MPRPQRNDKVDDRPSFCVLLEIGSFLSLLGAAGGGLIAVIGVMALENNRDIAISQLIIGVAIACQSLVSLGVMNALLWIVDMINGMSDVLLENSTTDKVGPLVLDETAEPLGEAVDKPVLKRRKL